MMVMDMDIIQFIKSVCTYNGNRKCPFCGSKESWLRMITNYESNEGWIVICKDCGARTAVYQNQNDAMMAWNDRFVDFIRKVITIFTLMEIIYIWIHVDRLKVILHTLF